MPTNTPTRGVPLRPEADRVKAPNPSSRVDPLHADMPTIPGVVTTPPPTVVSLTPVPLLILLAVIAIVGVIAWRLLPMRGAKPTANSGADADSAAQLEPPPSQPAAPLAQAPVGPVAVATLDELAAPWASKVFTFVNPATQESVPAMVIRLPGGAASRASAYWAFSLNAPYQTCELQFVTSISQLATKFGYRASHPMVASPCDGSIYDPLQVGSVPGGAFVRGLVVQGSGVRPPIAINVSVEGRSVIADRIE